MGSKGFGADKRLLQASEFKAVFQGPSYRVSTANMLLLARENELTQARLGLVVGKKHARKASQRNLIKRIARESFRLSHALVGVDIVLVARQGITQKDRAELREMIDYLWRRLKKKQHAANVQPHQNCNTKQ